MLTALIDKDALCKNEHQCLQRDGHPDKKPKEMLEMKTVREMKNAVIDHS